MRQLSLLLPVIGALGCGDALVTGDELEAGFQVRGRIKADADRELPASAKLGLLWVNPAGTSLKGFVEPSVLLDMRIEPDLDFALEVHGKPPPDAIAWLERAEGDHTFAFTWGEFVLFDDRDGDHQFRVGSLSDGSPIDEPDVYIGAASEHALLYVAQPLPKDVGVQNFSTAVTAVRGFHLAFVTCGGTDHTVQSLDDSQLLIEQVPASSTFPQLRPCLKTHVEP